MDFHDLYGNKVSIEYNYTDMIGYHFKYKSDYPYQSNTSIKYTGRANWSNGGCPE